MQLPSGVFKNKLWKSLSECSAKKKKKNIKSAINILRFILLKERFKAQFLYRENLHILLLQHIYFDVWMFAS